MNKKNLIFGIVGSIILTGGLIGTSVGIYYAIKNQKSDSTPIDSNVLNISEANTQYTSNYQHIYNLSTPVMFVYQMGQTEIGFQSGTAWVFDKSQDESNGLVTYYLATNLHVINLWEGSNGSINTNPINYAGLCIGKPKEKTFSSQNMTDNDNTPYFKWPYISNNNNGFNLSEWYMSETLLSWQSISNQNIFATPETISLISEPNIYTYIKNPYGATNGQYSYYLYPQLGLLEDADIGIIKFQIEPEYVNNYPFLVTFDNLINNGGIQSIYNLSNDLNQPISASIGGFPVMVDDNYNYSVWNSWNSSDEPNNCKITKGNSGRNLIQYQGFFTNPNNENSSSPYYGIANGANLHHGSSGSMVINNTNNKIEGIYWGGLQSSDNSFSGRFVPFSQNGILETWANIVRNNTNILGNTYIYQYYFQNSNNQPLPSSWNNLLMINPFLSKYLPFVISKQQ